MDIFRKNISKYICEMSFPMKYTKKFSYLKSSPYYHSSFTKAKKTTLQNNQEDLNENDYFFFKRVKKSVNNFFSISISDKNDKSNYELILRKISRSDKNIEGAAISDSINILLFIGISSYRRFNMQLAQKTAFKLLKDLNETDKYHHFMKELLQKNFSELKDEETEFFRVIWPNLLISSNNLNLYDNIMIDAFWSFYQKNKTQILENKIFPTKTVLSLIWTLLNFEVTQNSNVKLLLKEFLDAIWLKKENLDYINLLRFMWMNSYNDKLDKNTQKEGFSLLINNFSQIPQITFNHKNSLNIIQIMLNYFPEISIEFFKDDGSDKYEKCLNLIEKNNIFMEFFPKFYEICQTSYYVCEMNSVLPQKITFSESNDKNIPSYFFSKNLIKNKSSTFENNVCSTLDSLKIKYKKNIRIGIYEIDILVEAKKKKIVLEINGDSHCIYSLEGGRFIKSPRLLMKMKHLKQLGIHKFALINFIEWENIDYSKTKRQEFLINAIKKAEELE